jgi:hypothetical protein
MMRPIQYNKPKFPYQPANTTQAALSKCRILETVRAFPFPKAAGIEYNLFSYQILRLQSINISKPLTQNKTVNENTMGNKANWTGYS